MIDMYLLIIPEGLKYSFCDRILGASGGFPINVPGFPFIFNSSLDRLFQCHHEPLSIRRLIRFNIEKSLSSLFTNPSNKITQHKRLKQLPGIRSNTHRPPPGATGVLWITTENNIREKPGRCQTDAEYGVDRLDSIHPISYTDSYNF
jgi:hypothetical protein